MVSSRKGTYCCFSVGHDLVALELLALQLRLQRNLGRTQAKVLDVQRRYVSIEFFNLET